MGLCQADWVLDYSASMLFLFARWCGQLFIVFSKVDVLQSMLLKDLLKYCLGVSNIWAGHCSSRDLTSGLMLFVVLL